MDNAQHGIESFGNGELEKAKQAFLQCLTDLELQDPNRATIQNNIGSIYCMQNEYQKAREILCDALQEMQQQGHPHEPICKTNVAWVHAKLGNLGEAEKTIHEVLTSYKKTHSHTDATVLHARHTFGCILYQRKRYSEALTALQDVLDDKQQNLGPDNPSTLNTLTALTKVLVRHKKDEEKEKGQGDIPGMPKLRSETTHISSTSPTATLCILARIPQEIRDRIIDFLNPFDTWSLYQTGVEVDEKAIKHARAWLTIFKAADWLEEVSSAGVNPTLAGKGIERLYHGDYTNPIYLVLLDWALFRRQHPHNILDFLQEHEYDPVLKEVHVRGKNITINIQSIVDNYNYTGLENITKILSSDMGTSALYYNQRHSPMKVNRRESRDTLMYYIEFPHWLVPLRKGRKSVIWLFLEHPELSGRLRDAIATIPELRSQFQTKNDLINGVEGIRLWSVEEWQYI